MTPPSASETNRVRITDVAPRDGLQNEQAPVSAAEKIALVEALAATGVDEVEVTSFVNPKRVPQLADAAEVSAGVAGFVEGVRMVAGELPRDAGRVARGSLPTFSALVPNARGLEGAQAAIEGGLPLKIALFASATEGFSKANTGGTIAEVLERFPPVLAGAKELGAPVRLYVSCVVACPFDGPTDPAHVADVCARLEAMAQASGLQRGWGEGEYELDLGDTIGVARPDDIAALFSALPSDALSATTLHLHDTNGGAADCVKTALALGVRSFDGAAGGLGGCPFASTPGKRAPGNISTETLVRTVHEAGYETGVDETLLAEAGRMAAGLRGGAGA